MKKLAYIVFAIITIIGCQPTQATNNDTLITLQKTACYGKCPIYKATITADGTIHYTGEKFTPYTGAITTKLAKKQLQYIVQQFEAVQFDTYSNEYANYKISDIPSIIISYKGKMITMRGSNLPSKLVDLTSETEKAIEETLPKSQNLP